MSAKDTSSQDTGAVGTSRETSSEVEPPAWSTVATWVLATIFLVAVVAITAPFTVFLTESAVSGIAAAHGTLATLGVILGSISGYLAWRLLIGKIRAFSDLKILSALSSILAVITIVLGNWIYIAYRAKGGPRAFFLENNPAVHQIFFEFKEFIALFSLPLGVAVTYVIWSYKDQLIAERGLRSWLGIAVAIAWGALMIAFLLGAAITKLRSV